MIIKRCMLILVMGIFLNPGFSLADQEDAAHQAAMAQAKKDYKVFLEQLKALNSQYKEVTNEVKEVIKEEGVPVFDEETGEMVMKKDFAEDRPNRQEGPVFGDVDIKETDRDMIVKVDLPGLKKEEIKIKIENGKVLRITGQRDREKEELWNRGNVHTYQSERHYGRFHRLIELPSVAKDSGTEAQYENGVLTVRIPRFTDVKKEVDVTVK